MHRAPTLAVFLRLALAAARAALNEPMGSVQSIGCRLDRTIARWLRTVAGPNPSIIVRATTSRRSNSWKRCFGDSADTRSFESQQLLPPTRQQLVQSFSSGGGDGKHAKRVRRIER